jgi:hypothetical protein
MTGEIISKTAAADNTVKLLPEHGGLLARAKAHRLSDDRECFAIAEGDGDCDRVDAVVNDESLNRKPIKDLDKHGPGSAGMSVRIAIVFV